MTAKPHAPSLVPAVRTGEHVLTGKVGEGHEDVLYNLPRYPMTRYDGSAERGFVSDLGIFMNRKVAFKYAKKHKLLNDTVESYDDQLESGHLKLAEM